MKFILIGVNFVTVWDTIYCELCSLSEALLVVGSFTRCRKLYSLLPILLFHITYPIVSLAAVTIQKINSVIIRIVGYVKNCAAKFV